MDIQVPLFKEMKPKQTS